jgi:uncharacterized ferredoxin-like protein
LGLHREGLGLSAGACCFNTVWLLALPQKGLACLVSSCYYTPFDLLLAACLPVRHEESLILAGRFLLGLGVVAAIYGVVDFYFPIPIPHPFADQYIYLDGRMIRRAQGMLYEASSFGNLSAFFLSLTLVILLSWWKKLSVAW